MTRSKFLLFVAVLGAAVLANTDTVSAQEKMSSRMPKFNIVQYCQSTFPNSYTMKLSCMEGEKHSRDDLFNKLESIPDDILQYCSEIFRGSYTMLDSCIIGEMRSKKQWEEEKSK